jgi:hypothetical protein
MAMVIDAFSFMPSHSFEVQGKERPTGKMAKLTFSPRSLRHTSQHPPVPFA